MDISIVVPFRNEEAHIEKCVQALLSLDYPRDRYEIIMVDNNSNDRSAEIVRRYPDVRLYMEQELGDFAARNRGIAVARGSIIAFTDADTSPSRDWLKQIERAMSDSEVRLILGGVCFAPDSFLLSLLSDYESEKNDFIFSGNTKEIYYGYTCNMAVRKSVFNDIGRFVPVFRNADVVLVRRVVDAYSCLAARYARSAAVLRMEVQNIWAYFGKQHTYGRDLDRYRKIALARPLNFPERLRVFSKTVRRHNLSCMESLILLCLLSVGAACYEIGRLRGSPPLQVSMRLQA